MNTMIMTMAALALMPQPQQVRESDGFCPTTAKVTHVVDASLPPEGYRLSVAADSIRIASADAAGRFYAEQTLNQLKETNGYHCVEIRDFPAFSWRAVLVDEGRHFLGRETVKHIIDTMAQHKFNVLHWHLTEDQGWRIEVPGMPELVKYGSVRPSSPKYGADLVWTGSAVTGHVSEQNGEPYGPFYYTRAELKDIIAYASAHHVTIVPEVDMPGHMRGAIAAYPNLTCFPETITNRMAEANWGVIKDVLCMGNDEVLPFVKRVLDYVCEVFPSKVIHIGGDECPRINWKQCPKCQARMRREGLKDVSELQTWFTRQVIAYLESKGRRADGWDEYLNGDVPKSAIGQSWRTQSSNGAELMKRTVALDRGHDIVVSPHTECYYNYHQDIEDDPYQYIGMHLPLQRAYHFDPMKGLPASARPQVLGSEACVWGEWVWNRYDFDWKLWPRGCAMAEILWTYPKTRDYADFLRRLTVHRRRLMRNYVNCAPWQTPAADNAAAPSATGAARDVRKACAETPRPDRAWWMERHQAKLREIAERKSVNVVFLGDSITHYWEDHTNSWRRWTGDAAYGTLNLGFSGDRTENVLWRIANGELDGYSAKVIVLMIGTNNAGHFKESVEPPSNVAAGVKAILSAIRARQPQAKVVLCAILPRGKQEDLAANVPWRNLEANVLIRKFCDGRNVIWCDFGNQFLGVGGIVDRRLLPDQLHPSDAGYDRFGMAVMPVVDRLLGNVVDPMTYDKRMLADKVAQDDDQYEWHDGTKLWMEGRPFVNAIHPYWRLPESAQSTVGAGTWVQSQCASGISLRFRTNSHGFRIRWRVKYGDHLDGFNISSCGKSGIDVYRYDPKGNRFLVSGRLSTATGVVDVPVWSDSMEDYIVNLPSYNPLEMIEVGFKRGSKLDPPRKRASGIEKPVVFYGTSITQGGCASRPGLIFTHLLGSQLDVPTVNLGFSGNGKMEGDIGDYLAQIDASCYVIDTLWNMNRQIIDERYEKFVAALKAKRPGVPIILTGQTNVFNRNEGYGDKVARATAEKLGCIFVPAAELLPTDSEGTIDGCHLNDYGMTCVARGLAPVIRSALGR